MPADPCKVSGEADAYLHMSFGETLGPPWTVHQSIAWQTQKNTGQRIIHILIPDNAFRQCEEVF